MSADHVAELPRIKEIYSGGTLQAVELSPVFSDEIMSIVYDPEDNKPMVISSMTIGMLQDLGFSVDYSVANDSDQHLTLNDKIL